MKSFFFILFALAAHNLKAQLSDTSGKFKAKYLSGYFIFVRDSIPNTPSDVYLPRRQFDIYFLPDTNMNIINHLNNLDFPPKNGAVFVGGTIEWLADNNDRSNYNKWLSENSMYLINNRYSPFDTKKFPKELVDSKLRFISVFKGNVEAIGPFLPYTRHDIIKPRVYLYYPSNTSNTEYLFTIFFPRK